MHKNKNRGYQKLRVWNDAIDYYVKTCEVFRRFPYELKRVASQAMASSDSVHRYIADRKEILGNGRIILWSKRVIKFTA